MNEADEKAFCIYTCFTAAVVAAIATSALRFHRSQAFEVQLARDFDAAKRHAHAAVDIAMLRMRKYQDWRTRFNQSQWWNNASIDGGFYSVSVEDPVDLNLANDSRDPVLIKAVGTHNAAVYRLQVTVEVVPANGSCLDVTLMAADDISVSDAAVVCDQIIGCNSNVAASNSTIYSDVEAAQNISGATYHGTRTQSVSERKMPDAAKVLLEYTSSATTISIDSLPLFRQTEIINNTTFESNSSGWFATAAPHACTVSRTSSRARTGLYSLRVNNRSTFQSGAVYVASNGDPSLQKLISGHQYRLMVPVWLDKTCDIKVLCTIFDANNLPATYGEDLGWFSAKRTSGETGNYNHPSLEFRPVFKGPASRLEVRIQFRNEDQTYHIDDPTLVDITYPDNAFVFERNLLTPSQNPFGQPNSMGIYRFNCNNKTIAFGTARIDATVILTDPGINSGIYGPISWRGPQTNRQSL